MAKSHASFEFACGGGIIDHFLYHNILLTRLQSSTSKSNISY